MTAAELTPDAAAFLAESATLHALLAPLDAAALTQPTLFKGWSLERIIGHLHFWNHAAHASMTDEAAFSTLLTATMPAIRSGGLGQAEAGWLNGLTGPALISEWFAFAATLATTVSSLDPALRVRWVGPDMSVRSSITARLMESWAHGQAAFDALGAERQNRDSIRGIVVLGYNTYGWTFRNRGLEEPAPKPFLSLTAPSGAVWEFGDPDCPQRITGTAEEFCQIVTQVRNIADTQLSVTEGSAQQWLTIAQCFAGPPETPPAPGARCRSGS